MFAAKCREFGTVSNSSCESDATRHTWPAVRFPSQPPSQPPPWGNSIEFLEDDDLDRSKCPRTGSPWTASPISRNLRRCSRPKFPRHPVSLVLYIYIYINVYIYVCIYIYIYIYTGGYTFSYPLRRISIRLFAVLFPLPEYGCGYTRLVKVEKRNYTRKLGP